MDELRDYVETTLKNWRGTPIQATQFRAAIEYAIANTRHIYPELMAFKAAEAGTDNASEWTDALYALIRASGLPDTTQDEGKAGADAVTQDFETLPPVDETLRAEATAPEKELD